jgi:spermidine synthase
VTARDPCTRAKHFEAIRDRLASGGIYVQWLPLHQLDLEVFSVICRTFLGVFPDAQVMMAHFNPGHRSSV